MGVLKDGILKEICNEYRSEKEGSFLYRYLRNVKYKKECDREPDRAGEIIRKRAADLMYNIEHRSHSPLVELIEEWFAGTGQTVGASSDEIDIDLYQDLFEQMNARKRKLALIPIKVDPVMGGGLYIIGRNHYKGADFPYGDNYSCGIGIIGSWENRDERNKEVVLSLYGDSQNRHSFFAPWYGSRGMPSVEEALAWYDNVYLKNSRFWQIREWNKKRPASVPEKFDLFFESEDEDDLDF